MWLLALTVGLKEVVDSTIVLGVTVTLSPIVVVGENRVVIKAKVGGVTA